MKMVLWLLFFIALVPGCQSRSGQGLTDIGAPDQDPSEHDTGASVDDLIDPEGNGVILRAPLYPTSVPTISDIDWDAFPTPLTPSTPIRGREIWVSPEGSDETGDGTRGAPYRMVSRGLKDARDGDWVVVRGGDYPEAPEGEYRALLFEDNARGVTVTAYRNEEVIVRPGREGINYGADIGADNVVINGIDFHGFPRATVLIGRQGRTIHNTVLSNCDIEIDEQGIVDGIDMIPDNGGEPVVQGVLFHRVRVSGATIGIQCNTGPCNDLRVEGVVVRNSLGQGSGSDTIAVESGDNVVILDTEVTQAGADGIDLKASNVTIVGAYVHDVARNGVKLWHGGDVINSVISHTGADAAIVFDRSGHYRLLNSVVAYHNWRGLSSYVMTVGYDQSGDFEVDLVNTVFYRTAGGVWINPQARLRVQSCAFSEADNQVALDGPRQDRGGVVQLTYGSDPDLFRSYGLGSGNLLGIDPLFVDADNQDYHLKRGSPLIDAGTPEPKAPEVSMDGLPRPADSPVDIGPFEH